MSIEYPTYLAMSNLARNLTPVPPAQSNREMYQQGLAGDSSLDEEDEAYEEITPEMYLDGTDPDRTLTGLDAGILRELLDLCQQSDV